MNSIAGPPAARRRADRSERRRNRAARASDRTLPSQEARLRAGVRCADLPSHPAEFLDCTSVTLDESPPLVPPFEAAFHAHMAAWRLDGAPRTARQCIVYKTCPWPTPEDRLLFLLTSLKTSAL